MINIFYSWQSNTSTRHNRNFIESCLKSVVKKLNSSGEKFQEIIVDRDTLGLSGTPEIVNSIFDKINNSSVFIADVSIIGEISSNGKKKMIPNPNVMIELGYAASIIGWDNIICIFNAEYGNIEELPFDIRSRRMLKYNLNDKTDLESKSAAKKNITKIFQEKILDFDVENYFKKERVIELYKLEGESLISLIRRKPKLWGEKLILGLFDRRLIPLNEKIYDYDNGLIFRNTILMNNEEFFLWAKKSLSDFQKMASVITNLFEKELINVMSIEDEDSTLLGLHRTITRIVDLCTNSLEWEVLLYSIECPKDMNGIKNSMFGWSKLFTEALNKFVEELREFTEEQIRNPSQEGKEIIFTVEVDEHFVEYTNEMKDWMFKNPKYRRHYKK